MSLFGNIVIGLMSVFFIAFFFLREQGLFLDAIKSMVPNEYEERTTVTIEETSNLLIRYFVGILIQMTIITIFVSLALTVLGIPNALLIGFFAAIMNVIPYIGPILGAALGIIITISSGLDLSFYSELLPNIFKVMGVFFVMQMTDNFIIQPNIFSKSVKAHPLEIFIVVLIGAKIGGILGMVLAIPAYTALRVIAKVFLSEFKVVQRLTKNL
jgi:predicted PurR-regulated permease PerM